MTTIADAAAATQVYRLYLKAAPETIWEAITEPSWAVQYGYQAPVVYDLRPGGAYKGIASEEMIAQGAPELLIDGEVLEVDPPRRLVQTWHPTFDEETAAEAPSRLSWELEPAGDGVTMLTLVHELEDAPRAAAIVGGRVPEMGGGWSYVLSDLKTLLETGSSLAG